MPALFITEDEVSRLLDMRAALDAVEGAFKALAAGTAENVVRRRAAAPGFLLHNMHAAAAYLGVAGAKLYSTRKDAARFHVLLYGTISGELLAVIEADQLGRLRTGAVSGVATDLMARPDATTVGLFGTGRQARTQLEAVCKVRPVRLVEVYGRDADRCAAFAEEMSRLLGIEVTPALKPDFVAAEKDILITATSAKTPLFDGQQIADGTHLNVVGSNMLRKTEIDTATVQAADVIVCDSVAACRDEAGDFVAAIEAGVTDWPLMHDLSAVVAGRATGRGKAEDVTLFKSVGLAIEDVALGYEAFRRAKEFGFGTELPF